MDDRAILIDCSEPAVMRFRIGGDWSGDPSDALRAAAGVMLEQPRVTLDLSGVTAMGYLVFSSVAWSWLEGIRRYGDEWIELVEPVPECIAEVMRVYRLGSYQLPVISGQ